MACTFITQQEFRTIEEKYGGEYDLCIDWERNIYAMRGKNNEMVRIQDIKTEKSFLVPIAYVTREEYNQTPLWLISITKKNGKYTYHWRDGILGPIKLPH